MARKPRATSAATTDDLITGTIPHSTREPVTLSVNSRVLTLPVRVRVCITPSTLAALRDAGIPFNIED